MGIINHRGVIMRNRQKGFSLIELLIVVAIILIIAGIAIPKVMQTRGVANETAAIGNLSTLNKVLLMYSVTYNAGFPPSLTNLQSPSGGGQASAAAADLIDPVLAAGSKSGYMYTYTPGPAVNGVISSYTINADPIEPGKTGTRFFFTDQSGTIRQNFGARATSTSPPI
jgi:prepilin-type N-terminal cleavage/methylation domain-containing protein